ncbi:MAG: SDR family oxidoreductase [Akkermansiaceae bacterium]|jgi:NADP-dependent 3-hydroxy acid dehydrogenase YdfG|nr:SDR family oxidoreductase [Akkermansiaceae bacterium]
MSNESIARHFRGKIVILTGAASGIGRALAVQLASAGAVVHAADANKEGLDSLRAELKGKAEGEVIPCVLDVRDGESFIALANRVVETHSRIDFFFNNAGVTQLGESQNIPFERWKWLLDINLMGVVHGILAIYPIMVRQKHGQIINTASIAGLTGYATASAYTASKAAVLELTRSLRSEARIHKVRISAACPGYVSSGIFAEDRIVGADLKSIIKAFPTKMMTPQVAASHMLAGVVTGKETIVFPFSAKFLWALSNWAPGLTAPFQQNFIKVFYPS